MQALILVGGEGTRLRPLTAHIPKPVVTLVDRPFLAYMLEWLASHGVDDVIMSCGFKAETVRAVLGDGEAYGVRIRYAEEPRPLGTGGALKFCEDLLDDRFLMLNGDVLSDIDLTAQIEQHERTGATGTLALVPVRDPSNYGLVRTAADDSVLEFLEKPEGDVGNPSGGPPPAASHSSEMAAQDGRLRHPNTISAGAYVLERSVTDLLEPGANASIEREVFPRLVGNGLYARVSNRYWLDIGTPDRYLQGTFDILEGRVATRVRANGGILGGPVEGTVEAPSVIGPGAAVGRGSVVSRAVVLAGARVGEGCVIRESIICPGAVIPDGAEVVGEVVA